MPWTYILECSDGSYYVGSTFDLDRRMWEHNHSDTEGAAYTRRRRPVRLVWSAHYDSVVEAFAYEKQIQGWSRKKREALIDGEFEHLPGLARRRTSSTDRWSLPGAGGFETGAERLPQPPSPEAGTRVSTSSPLCSTASSENGHGSVFPST